MGRVAYPDGPKCQIELCVYGFDTRMLLTAGGLVYFDHSCILGRCGVAMWII